MRKLLIITLLVGIGLSLRAQSDVDALRYSLSGFGFTARSAGSGGAFGSIGADMGALSINPASLAQYKKSEFSITMGTLNSKNTSDYIGNTTKDNIYNFNMPSIGLVFTNRYYVDGKPVNNGWVNTNFGISINRVADFNRVINYSGVNSTTSLLDYFAEQGNGYTVNQIRGTDDEFANGFNDIAPMFWESYLIDSVGDRTYGAAISPDFRNISQKNVINTSGKMYQYTFTFSGNYQNKLYIGADVNITSVRYEEKNRFSEFDDPSPSSINVWNNYQFNRSLVTKGAGVSGRLGLIYRASDQLRAGIAYQTPILLGLTDNYSDQLQTVLDNGSSYNFSTKEGQFDYQVVTPAKTTVSASYFAGKKGFISADAEFADYSTMRLRADGGVFDNVNSDISNKYGSTVNLRLGGEYVIKQFRLRAGYANYGNPLTSVAGSSNRQNFFTGGLGIYERNWSLDLALIRQQKKDVIQPYTLTSGQPQVANNTLVNNRVMVTLSTRF